MSDLTSRGRQAVIDALNKKRIETMEKGKDVNLIWECLDVVAQLPFAQPDNQVHLCDSCKHTYPDCPSQNDDVIFGNGDDNICACAEYVPSAQPEQRWIPIKVRPMDDEERKVWSDWLGHNIEDDEAVMFDCPMPDDGQEVWICSKCGNVWQDTCQIDEGIYLEGNGDWLDIVAWMPLDKPEPYKEEGDE